MSNELDSNPRYQWGADLAEKIPRWAETVQGLPEQAMSNPVMVGGGVAAMAALAGAGVVTPRLARRAGGHITGDASDLLVGESLEGGLFTGKLPARLPWPDRRTGMRIIGPTGSGKTTATIPFALDDLMAGRDVFALEIHGDLGGTLITYAKALGAETIVCDASDKHSAFWNPLAGDDTEEVANRIAAAISSCIYFHGFYGPQGETAVRNFVHLARDYVEHVRGDDPSTTDWKLLTDLMWDTDFLHKVLETYTPEGSKRQRVGVEWLSPNPRAWFDNKHFALPVDDRNRNMENVTNLMNKLASSAGAKHMLYPSEDKRELDLHGLLNDPPPSGAMGRLIVVRAPVQVMAESHAQTIAYLAIKTMRDATLARRAPEHPVKPLSIFLDEMPSLIGQAGEDTQREISSWLTLVRDKNCAPHLTFQSHALMPRILQEALDATCRNFLVFGGSSADEVERIRKSAGIEETELEDTRTSYSRGGKTFSRGKRPGEKKRLDFDTVKYLRRGEAIFMGVKRNADQLPLKVGTRKAPPPEHYRKVRETADAKAAARRRVAP